MIKGITNAADGQPIQRLAVSTKVAIGLPPDPAAGRKAPMKLDCFIFLKKSAVEQNKWEIDQELHKVYGKKCKEFEIVLLDDDLEHVFPTKLAWFTTSECKCFGDGETATRRTQEHPDGQPWTPCGKTCPDFERGDCKPSGDLRFMLAAFPQLGSVARIHTSSYRSIMQISSSLQQIQTITGGRLAGIRAKLVVRPEKTSYLSEKDQKRHSTTIYALNLEIKADGIRELVERMTDHARLFEQTRKMLGTGRIEVLEPDDDRAEEIQPEFYPASQIAPVVFPKPDEAEEIVETPKRANMKVACKDCGQVNGHSDDCKTQKPKETPAMCAECRKVGGHTADCKFADKPKSEPPKPVESLYVVHSAERKESKAYGPYVILNVVSQSNQKGILYVWDKATGEHFLDRDYGKGLPMMAAVSEQEKGGKKFFGVDKLLELGGEVFGAEPETVEGVENLFGEEQP